MELNYFFEHIDDLNFKNLFTNCIYSQDALKKLNDYITNLVGEEKINNGEMSDYISINGNYYIGKNTKIGNNVTIEGPVYIGNNVTILPNAYIRPYSLIGDNVVIGHSCVTKHCIIMNNAKVQNFTFVGDSIIGYKTRVGSGTILANRRFDQNNVILKYDNEKIDLQTDFFGSVIGDESRLGANVTTYPGTFIGKNTFIFPGTVIKGFVPSFKKVSLKYEYNVTENDKYELK